VWTYGFLGGITIAARFSELPSIWVISLLTILAITIYQLPLRQYSDSAKIISAGLLAISWFSYQAHKIVIPLPEKFIHCPINVTGTVASIPEASLKRVQFEYLIDSIEQTTCKPMRVLVSQYHYGKSNKLSVTIGERWQLTLRLKKARGFWNWGSFDYEAFLLQKGIQWTGVIVEKKPSKHPETRQNIQTAQQIDSYFTYQTILYAIEHFIYQCRKHISENLSKNIQRTTTFGLLNAIVTGFRESITEEQWQIMRVTGTNHLFSISGLHVSFIGGILYGVVNLTGRYIARLPLYIPVQQVAYFTAWLGAVAYSVFSGFALPVKRASIMTTVFTFTLLKRRVLPVWRGWCIALMLILLFEPFVVLSESFWLSFGTIAIIFYSLGKRLYLPAHLSMMQRCWIQWGHIHWIIGIGLLPLTILFFQQVAIWGFFANLVAIPWMGFVILPNALLGALIYLISPSLGNFLLGVAEQAMHALWLYLSYIAQLPLAHHTIVITHLWIFCSTILGIFLYLSPKGLPGRYYLTTLFLLPLLLCKPAQPASGEFWLTLLDVGQGLAAVVRTQNRLLIYDTGPRLGPEFDTGKVVLLPYLRHLNLRTVDKLIISHGDNDHSGGAQSILQNLSVKAILASQPEQLKHPLAQFGYAGQSWEWDNVKFRILHPPLQSTFKGNDNSCVLHITNGVHSVLLPGDIHRKAETDLLKTHPNIRSTVLIAPHHGSKTSSSIPFINAVKPRYVLFPVGYRNRFRFPHTIVLNRYAQYGSQLYSTAKQGAIMMKLGTTVEQIKIECFASSNARFWKHAY